MKNMVVLVDANVILDYVITREPYYQDAYKIIDMCYSGQARGYLAFHSVTGTSHESVLKAVDMDDFIDFEDCLQDRCAESVNAQYIITNNVKDFKESVITAITPHDFDKMISSIK